MNIKINMIKYKEKINMLNLGTQIKNKYNRLNKF